MRNQVVRMNGAGGRRVGRDARVVAITGARISIIARAGDACRRWLRLPPILPIEVGTNPSPTREILGYRATEADCEAFVGIQNGKRQESLQGRRNACALLPPIWDCVDRRTRTFRPSWLCDCRANQDQAHLPEACERGVRISARRMVECVHGWPRASMGHPRVPPLERGCLRAAGALAAAMRRIPCRPPVPAHPEVVLARTGSRIHRRARAVRNAACSASVSRNRLTATITVATPKWPTPSAVQTWIASRRYTTGSKGTSA